MSLKVEESSMDIYTQFIKSLIRPFIIVWGCITYGICIVSGIEVPAILSGLIAAIIIEYFTERAVKRLKEK